VLNQQQFKLKEKENFSFVFSDSSFDVGEVLILK
jgi:hypothetical protein